VLRWLTVAHRSVRWQPSRPTVRAPLAEAPNPVTGYSLIAADTIEAAIELAKGCPILLSGGRIEVGETFEVM